MFSLAGNAETPPHHSSPQWRILALLKVPPHGQLDHNKVVCLPYEIQDLHEEIATEGDETMPFLDRQHDETSVHAAVSLGSRIIDRELGIKHSMGVLREALATLQIPDVDIWKVMAGPASELGALTLEQALLANIPDATDIYRRHFTAAIYPIDRSSTPIFSHKDQ